MSKKCIVICSGGLDSTTAAAHAKHIDGKDVILMHFEYGCLAAPCERKAIKEISFILDTEYVFHDIKWLSALGGSSLTEKNSKITGPIEGAEYPHEWVPARNFLFLSHAAAICDAKGIEDIYMGLNLEEGAVYPDNTIEFYKKVEDILQFATLVRPKIHMPLARMMKWQIVKYAYEIEAPIHHSWSCYRGGELHCGNCGPCYMRKTAHKMLKIEDTVRYMTDTKDY